LSVTRSTWKQRSTIALDDDRDDVERHDPQHAPEQKQRCRRSSLAAAHERADVRRREQEAAEDEERRNAPDAEDFEV